MAHAIQISGILKTKVEECATQRLCNVQSQVEKWPHSPSFRNSFLWIKVKIPLWCLPKNSRSLSSILRMPSLLTTLRCRKTSPILPFNFLLTDTVAPLLTAGLKIGTTPTARSLLPRAKHARMAMLLGADGALSLARQQMQRAMSWWSSSATQKTMMHPRECASGHPLPTMVPYSLIMSQSKKLRGSSFQENHQLCATD